VFTSESAAMQALKQGRIRAGDVMVLIGIGPLGTGMEETAQITIALKHLPFGAEVALLTDGRFSGVSTGACVGHIGPEALAGGPVGKVRDDDWIRIAIDLRQLDGRIDFIDENERRFTPEEGSRILESRAPHPGLAPHPALPDDTRLWAALQQAGGGTWGGCVFDVDRITQWLAAGRDALARAGHGGA
jgi:dihydroxyacid dehydratase/phosphogluconate dehydratase